MENLKFEPEDVVEVRLTTEKDGQRYGRTFSMNKVCVNDSTWQVGRKVIGGNPLTETPYEGEQPELAEAVKPVPTLIESEFEQHFTTYERMMLAHQAQVNAIALQQQRDIQQRHHELMASMLKFKQTGDYDVYDIINVFPAHVELIEYLWEDMEATTDTSNHACDCGEL